MTPPKKPREFWINDASGKYAIGSKAIKGAFKVREVVGAQKVDEELNKAAETFVASNQCEVMDTTMAHEDTFKAGAEWQKAKDAEEHEALLKMKDLEAKVKEQTIREVLEWLRSDEYAKFCDLNWEIAEDIETRFILNREVGKFLPNGEGK